MYKDSKFPITLRKSVPRQVDKKSRGPQGEGGLEFSRSRKGQTFFCLHSFSSVQSLSRVRLFATLWITAHQASLSITNSRSSLRLTSIESVIPSSHLILCRPLLLLPPIPPSIPLFQWVNSSHEVAKVLELQLQYHSFQRNPRADLLQNGLVGSPCSPGDSQESSPTPQFTRVA